METVAAVSGEALTVQPEIQGLSRIGRALLDAMEGLIESVVERMRGDPNLNVAAGLQFSQLVDHLPTLLADVAGALVMIEELKGQLSPLLADATEIQRLVSERHGLQRRGLGWSESALRREFMIVREEAVGADSSWFCRWPATQDRGILPAGSGNVGPSAFRSINSLRPDVVLLERRGGAVAIAARRVAAGRVVQLGDEDTWQGRMTGGERCRFHFTRVSVSCHACKSGPR